MILGLYSGASGMPAAGAADAQKWLVSNPRPLQVQFLDPTQSWANGMVSNFYINTCAGATKAIITVPMLVGPSVGSPVDSHSGTGQTTSPSGPAQGVFPGSPTPTTMTLTDVAAGVWDTLFTACFTTIAGVRPDAILRIGWEMYGSGSFYPWSGPGLAAEHAAAFQHLVTLARSISASFKFDWNGAIDIGVWDPMTGGGWPGASYVDYVTADCYQNIAGGSGAAGWANSAAMLAEGLAFAKTNGKPFCITEFGLWPSAEGGSGDDPNWLKGAYFWMRENEAALGYVNYFNSPGDANNLANMPKSGPLWQCLFGEWASILGGASSYRFLTSGANDRLRQTT